ncbi:MAG: LemA family protein [Parvibaculum sp.]
MDGYGFYIFLGLIALTLVWAVRTYNSLILSRQRVEEGWSGIDVQLRRRSNLIPNLVETVKAFASHEEGTLTKVTELRRQSAAAETSGDTAKRAAAEGQMSGALMHLFAVAENYPDLKANQNFLDLQNDLSEIEEEIQLSRRYYNGAARQLNVAVESVPSNIIANFFKFEKATYFEMPEEDRAVPNVSFS